MMVVDGVYADRVYVERVYVDGVYLLDGGDRPGMMEGVELKDIEARKMRITGCRKGRGIPRR